MSFQANLTTYRLDGDGEMTLSSTRNLSPRSLSLARYLSVTEAPQNTKSLQVSVDFET